MRVSRTVRFPARGAIVLCTALVIATATAAGCGGGRDGDHTTSLRGFTRTPAPQVGHLSLPDVAPPSSGAPMRLRAGAGRLLLVYFGYTSCPDVCPTTFADVRAAIGQLPAALRGQVAVALVTVDPARDTAKAMNRYMSHFFAGWHALRTTDAAALRRVEQAFGARHERERPRADGTYAVSHTALLYAVDEHGAIRVEWPFGTPPADIAPDLRTLLTGTAATT